MLTRKRGSVISWHFSFTNLGPYGTSAFMKGARCLFRPVDDILVKTHGVENRAPLGAVMLVIEN